MIVTLPWDGIGKWNTRYCQLSSLLTSSLALKDILPSLKIYFFVLFFYDWEISHISCCCCCCRFSFLVFTVTLSPSIPPNLSLSETLITMVESNPPRRLNVHQALGGGSGPLSLSLSKSMHTYSYSSCIYTQLCMNLRILYAHPWIRFLLSHRLP